MGVDTVDNPMSRIFVLATSCDATQLNLTAAEGFLLSRIDGTTPLRLLREMGGMPASEVDACVERWLSEGVLELVEGKSQAAATSGSTTKTSSTSSASAAPPEKWMRASPMVSPFYLRSTSRCWMMGSILVLKFSAESLSSKPDSDVLIIRF